MIDKNIYLKKGELASLREQRQSIRYICDAIVKGLLLVFDPMDMDCGYVDTFDQMKLGIYVGDLKKKRLELDQLNKRIEQLENELGANA